jgi:predicted nucleic acid-binding protein
VSPNFLDTVGLIAVWDESDQWHMAASAAYAGSLGRREPVVTTTWILMECGNAAARRPYRSDVDDLRLRLSAQERLLVPTDEDLDRAWANDRRGEAGSAGIVDHVSFVVMRRLGLSRVFTNDAHFRAAGFETLF